MNSRQRALAWMKEQCGAADGPRFVAAGEPDVPGEPHCDCLETLERLLNEVRDEALETAARVVYRRGGCDEGVEAIRVLKVGK
jgi:hypothetical protein